MKIHEEWARERGVELFRFDSDVVRDPKTGRERVVVVDNERGRMWSRLLPDRRQGHGSLDAAYWDARLEGHQLANDLETSRGRKRERLLREGGYDAPGAT